MELTMAGEYLFLDAFATIVIVICQTFHIVAGNLLTVPSAEPAKKQEQTTGSNVNN